MIKSVGVFLGAVPGTNPLFLEGVKALAKALCVRQLRLVYGGSSNGLMGALARAMLDHDGMVTGIISHSLVAQEHPLHELDKLIITDTLHERKRLIVEKSDALIVFPGGLGTLDEAFEVWNALKIKTLDKPFAFLNIDSFYDKLFEFIRHCISEGMLAEQYLHTPIIENNVEDLMNQLIA